MFYILVFVLSLIAFSMASSLVLREQDRQYKPYTTNVAEKIIAMAITLLDLSALGVGLFQGACDSL